MNTGFFAGREDLRSLDVAIVAVGRPANGEGQRTRVIDVSEIGAFLGLDVGKRRTPHHRLHPRRAAFGERLPNSEPKRREVFGKP
ncbi:hypothetical protein ACFCXT_23240 [Streptomyces vinaceus]|uniref:hypothetical protein n=1 Tax=Streptomyces vinaceus TaxID=1960 RepID=UPI0035DE1C1F